MFRVLLADDEITAIRYLERIIQAYLPEFEIAAAVESGLAALDVLQRDSIDVLITDIRMPGLNGIELAKASREMLPDLRIVIISGYSLFEYAKGAIAAHVDDYLLKPLSIDNVVEVLKKVSSRLTALHEEKRRQVLLDLIEGVETDAKWRRRFLPESAYPVSLVRFGNLPQWREHLSKRRVPRQVLFIGGSNVITGRDDQEYIVIGECGEDVITQLAAHCYKDPANRGASTTIRNSQIPVKAINGLLMEMQKSLDGALVMGRTQTLTHPTAPAAPVPSLKDNELRQLAYAIENRSIPIVKEILVAWAVEWENKRVPQRFIEAYVDQIIERAVISIPGLGERRARIRQEITEVFYIAASVGDVVLGLWDILFSSFVQGDMKEAEAIASDIREYIQNNCTKPLTLQSVCACFGISQAYLGRLLRRYADTSFGEYLTGCRMDMARALILKHPDMKLKDVAHLSGYDDPSYFSKVFLKHTGMTPSQYALRPR